MIDHRIEDRNIFRAYENLANAIVLTAAEDYRKAMHGMRRWPEGTDKHDAAQRRLREVERFFRSDWYRTLTSIDGEMLMRMLRDDPKPKSDKPRYVTICRGKALRRC